MGTYSVLYVRAMLSDAGSEYNLRRHARSRTLAEQACHQDKCMQGRGTYVQS